MRAAALWGGLRHLLPVRGVSASIVLHNASSPRWIYNSRRDTRHLFAIHDHAALGGRKNKGTQARAYGLLRSVLLAMAFCYQHFSAQLQSLGRTEL